MSLELAAQHLASRGRKGDSMLVHMAPEEVSGLQALARAAGGTLTLNPDTGLPEANFLKRMLPALIGAGLMFATGGAAAPGLFGLSKAATIGLGLGGAETLRTGSLEKGLMAGLGAYGGAGLTGGLMGAGAAGTTGAAGTAPAMSMAPATASPATTALMKEGITGLAPAAAPAASTAAAASTTPGMLKYGLAALSPTLQADAAAPFAGSGPNPYEFEYDPTTQRYTRVPVGTRQRDILAPTTQMAADGGMMNSGPIEDMSNQNRMDTMMANSGQMFAAGGQVNLQGTFTAGDQGGGGPFGQANANGYQAAGSGAPLQGFSSSFGQMGSNGSPLEAPSNGFDTPGGIPSGGGLDPRAVQANPQGFAQYMAQMGQREQQMPGSTMMGGYGQAMRGLGGMGGGQGRSLQQLAAQMTPEQRAANQRQMEMLTGYGPNGFNHGGSNQMMLRNAEYRPERDDAIIAANNANRNSPAESYGSYAAGGMASMARGGPSHLGDYSDGGRLLKGPGDGVSDSIPATIANKRPARLADGEFVVPARIVSELGNGSTEAGARKLYAMMDRVQKARGKTTGKNRVAVNSRAEKLLPA
jgi:hypothetical protein